MMMPRPPTAFLMPGRSAVGMRSLGALWRVIIGSLLLTASQISPASEYLVGLGGFGSIQEAVDAAMSGPARNSSGNAVIRVSPGVWKGFTVAGATPNAGGNIGSSFVEIVGSTAAATTIEDNSVPGSCGVVIATNSAAVLLRHIRVQTSPSVTCQSALFAQNGALIVVGQGLVLGNARKQHMHAEAHGIVEVYASYTVDGSAEQHWAVSTGGLILIDPNPLEIIFNRRVSFEHFAWAQSNGVILVGADASGRQVRLINPELATARFRYSVQSNGVIDLNGGQQPLPGTKSHVATGGQYVNGP